MTDSVPPPPHRPDAPGTPPTGPAPTGTPHTGPAPATSGGTGPPPPGSAGNPASPAGQYPSGPPLQPQQPAVTDQPAAFGAPVGGPPPGPTPAGGPPPDWYPDPERPKGLRYWDGEGWTEHRHIHVDRAPSGLPRIGDGFGQWIQGITDNLKHSALMLLALPVPGFLLIIFGAWVGLRNLGFETGTDFRGNTTVDDVTLPGAGSFVVGGLLCVLGMFMVMLFRVASIRMMWDAHAQQPVSFSGAIRALAGRPGRVIFGYLWPVILYVASFVAVFALAAITPAFLLLLLLAIPLFIWLIPYLGMYEVAIAAGPKGESPVSGARRLVRGRWGPIAGRVLLAGIAAAIGGSAVNWGASLALTPITAGVGDSAVEFSTTPTGFEVMRDGVPTDSFRVAEVVPATLAVVSLAIFAIVYGVSTGLQYLFSASANANMAAHIETIDGAPAR